MCTCVWAWRAPGRWSSWRVCGSSAAAGCRPAGRSLGWGYWWRAQTEQTSPDRSLPACGHTESSRQVNDKILPSPPYLTDVLRTNIPSRSLRPSGLNPTLHPHSGIHFPITSVELTDSLHLNFTTWASSAFYLEIILLLAVYYLWLLATVYFDLYVEPCHY